MDLPDLKPGLTGVARRTVTLGDTAEALGSGDVPVFGTPALIALMEQAAVAALAGALPADMTSVGIFLKVHHMAATPPGMAVSAQATVTTVDGRTVTFEVTATDTVEQIGQGVHRRILVDRARFRQRAESKQDAPQPD